MINFTMLIRNRAVLTKQALQSLISNTHDGVTMSVLLDDRSDEPLASWLKDCGGDRNDTPMGTGMLRNLTVKLSEERHGRGEYLYLSDNDVYFTQGWLTKLVSCYELAWSHGIRALGAYNHPFNQPLMELRFTNGMNVHTVNHLASQSMLMRWEVWDQFGPFIDTPVDKVCQSEDVVFSNKIREAGFKVGVVSPALIVNTGITNSFGEHIPGWEMVRAACPTGVICE